MRTYEPSAGWIGRIRFHLRQHGLRSAVNHAVATALYPVLRVRDRLIWEIELRSFEPSVWGRGERLMILGPENIDATLTPGLRSFLGGARAQAEISGVRNGDRLFVVATDSDYLACSYIFFDTTRETRRQARIYGERQGTPIIGMSFTAPEARGRGLYRRILNEMFSYLAKMNFDRAVCEVHPGNHPSNKASQAAGMCVCRRLCDLALFNRLYIQRVTTGSKSRWRVLWV
jgi:RimJ/RimL family protein N-acetyltransferase